ncbi:hypothetical protein HFO27_13445 [Rhizobium leguminosarum]|uniref:hypothetical protein n=1 Tax=Rhizobium leguminosarum TaxID=384 RepID=UPI001C90F663|nr:hypothetical protein [Rhizobium leguminosarum]MBY3175636.1 hypothetical protein [Rhizobium leguminosarum]
MNERERAILSEVDRVLDLPSKTKTTKAGALWAKAVAKVNGKPRPVDESKSSAWSKALARVNASVRGR